MIARARHAAALILLATLAACAAWPQPETPAERVGVAYASIEATAKATTERVAAGAITPEQAEDVLQILLEAKAIADVAAAAVATDRPQDADVALDTVRAILTRLEEIAR